MMPLLYGRQGGWALEKFKREILLVSLRCSYLRTISEKINMVKIIVREPKEHEVNEGQLVLIMRNTDAVVGIFDHIEAGWMLPQNVGSSDRIYLKQAYKLKPVPNVITSNSVKYTGSEEAKKDELGFSNVALRAIRHLYEGKENVLKALQELPTFESYKSHIEFIKQIEAK